MAIDYVSLASGAVTILSPFLPYLVSLGGSVQKKLEDVIAEQGGDVIWRQAEQVWAKISGHFSADPVVSGAATMVADGPDDTARQRMLTEVLAQRLQQDPSFAAELTSLLGGTTGVQQVVAGNAAIIEDIRQSMARAGRQTVQGGDKARIRNVRMDMGR